jgi:P22 coat protein - gene protein 5
MAGNNLLTPSMITRYSIPLFLNSNMFMMSVNRDYDDRFGVEGAKIGAQLRVRIPNDYSVTDGPGLSLQDTIEQQVQLTVATQRHVDIAFTTAERTLSIEDYAERLVMPRTNKLAGNVAQTLMFGSQGAVPNAAANVDANNNILAINQAPVLLAGALLDDNSAPDLGTMDARKLANDPHTDAKLVVSLAGQFNPASRISKQFETGTMKNALGFDMFRDQTVIKHTTGSATTATINGANQAGTALTIAPLVGTINQGDVFTVAGVNAVNRTTFASTGTARQFTATANVPAGATSLPCYPAVIPAASQVPYAGLPYTAQAYMTVTAPPANNAVVTPFANASVTYRQSLAFQRDAVSLVIAPLWIPPNGKGVVEAARHEFDRCSIRSLVCYEPGTDQPIDRLDVLFGFFYPRGEWACQTCDSL